MNITLLTQPSCEYCDHAHAILTRLAGEFGFELITLSFDSDTGADLARRGGLLFAPGVVIDGTAFSHGRLSERKLRRALARRLGADKT